MVEISDIRERFRNNGEKVTSPPALAFIRQDGQPFVSQDVREEIQKAELIRAYGTLWNHQAIQGMQYLEGFVRNKYPWMEIEAMKRDDVAISLYFDPHEVSLKTEKILNKEKIWKVKGVRVVVGRARTSIDYLARGSVRAGVRASYERKPDGWKELHGEFDLEDEKQMEEALKNARTLSTATFADVHGDTPEDLVGTRRENSRAKRLYMQKLGKIEVAQILF